MTMKNILINTTMFAAGISIGFLATWKFAESKYRKISREEISSIKEAYSCKRPHIDSDESGVISVGGSIPATMLNSNSINSDVKKVGAVNIPFVIHPDVFGENEEYDTDSLVYYADGILADDQDYVIEDREGTVGTDWVNRFGEFEEDTVYVENDTYRAYYEITKDYRSYKDIYPGFDGGDNNG